jgi:hypothetical protein
MNQILRFSYEFKRRFNPSLLGKWIANLGGSALAKICTPAKFCILHVLESFAQVGESHIA